MGDCALIEHRLALALRPVDAVTGRAAARRGGRAFLDGAPLHYVQREDGFWVFLAFPPEGGLLSIRLPGYETAEYLVKPELLGKAPPILDLPLIPAENNPDGDAFYTLRGNMAGITALDAVRAGESLCMVRGFDRAKGALSFFNVHGLALEARFYALVKPEKGHYEAVEITGRTSGGDFRLASPPLTEPDSSFVLAHRVSGAAGSGGDYLLRVRNDGAKAKWLLRWQIGAEEFFRTIDFGGEETPRLTLPPADGR